MNLRCRADVYILWGVADGFASRALGATRPVKDQEVPRSESFYVY